LKLTYFRVKLLPYKSRIVMVKATFNKKRALFTSKMDLELRKELVQWFVWSIALCGAETGTLRAADQKHLESFERMEKISWTNREKRRSVTYSQGAEEYPT
jgi:hypothetical protein